jgi:hypothetical protein
MHGTVKKVFSFKKMEKITQRNGCVKKPRKEGRKKDRETNKRKEERDGKNRVHFLCVTNIKFHCKR